MPATARQFALTAVALLIAVAPAGAQISPIEIYRDAVATYLRTGDTARAVQQLAGLDQDKLPATVKDVIAHNPSADRDGAALLEMAALLHLEIGIATAGISTVTSQAHFDLGERLVDALVPRNDELREAMSDRRKAEIATIRSTWLAVAGSTFLSVNDTTHARTLLRKAAGISPRSAAILTLQGTADEIDGSFLNADDWEGSNLKGHIGRERSRLLFAAERLYREALRMDPAYPLAQIRLGRVSHLKVFLKEAEQWLTKGSLSATEPSHKYLAAMFTGALQQDQKNLDGARTAFETALAIAPRSQNAVVALAYVELLSGRADRARSLAQGYLMTPNSDDTWWASKNGALDLVGLQWLRQRVRQ